MAKTKDETAKAFENPKAGMRFSEMYSHWVYILSISNAGAISTMEFNGHPAAPIRETIKYQTYKNLTAFCNKFAYGSIIGYWVRYIDDRAFERLAEAEIVSLKELSVQEHLYE